MTRKRCVYCGLPQAQVRSGERVVTLPTCRAHTDLLSLDPNYGLVTTLAADAGDDERGRRRRARPP